MDIKKTDSKGRISLGVPNTHYVVCGGETAPPGSEGVFRLIPVPVMGIDSNSYESSEVSAAKDEVRELLYSMGVDEKEHDLLHIADRIVNSFGPNHTDGSD